MLKAYQNHINQNLPFLKEGKLLVAISGGLDSVVLAHLCHQLELNIAFAHCNFNLRAEESDADEAFVLQFAKDLNVECFVQRFDTLGYAKKNKESTQMAARNLRYEWFDELAEVLRYDYILTAHHADDNLETFLINLSRGTGLEGLTGIPEINEAIIRPILGFSRAQIENFANQNKLQWRDDSTNASTKYLRNKLRHEVIPILKGINPQLLQNFAKTQDYLKEAHEIIDDRIISVSEQIISTINEDEIHFDIAQLKALNNPKAYLYELLKDYGFTEWNDVYDLLEAQSGKLVFSSTHRLIKDRTCLLLSKLQSDLDQDIVIENLNTPIDTPFGVLQFEDSELFSGTEKDTIFVDKNKLEFPLTLRKWHEGDYFYPMGMTGKKKLSKYFKDEKLSLIAKENVLLLCSGDDIVWVVNRRADNRFKCTEATTEIIKITLKN